MIAKTKLLLCCAVFFILIVGCTPTEENSQKQSAPKDAPLGLAHHPIPAWFEQDKFGIFVHYAVGGTFSHYKQEVGYSGHGMLKEVFEAAGKALTISDAAVYEWAANFKKWGARYAVLTASQHPGMALWDSKVTDRTITKLSPYGGDLVETWTKALRKEGLRVGIYFNHEDMGDLELMRILKEDPTDKFESPYWNKFLEKRDAKVEELVANYGKVDLLWFDADWIARDAKELGTARLVDMIVQHQPEVVMNNRLRSAHHGHYGTPEKYIPILERDDPWEACDNLRNNNLWGYVYDEELANNYRSAQEIIYTLKEAICSGGNYLLNIGPQPDGQIVPREAEIMDSVGVFVNQFETAIFNTKKGLPRSCFGEGSTYKDGKLYLFTQKNGGEIYVKGLMNKVLAATELKTGKDLKIQLFGGRRKANKPEIIKIEVPENTSGLPNVIELAIEGELEIQNR